MQLGNVTIFLCSIELTNRNCNAILPIIPIRSEERINHLAKKSLDRRESRQFLVTIYDVAKKAGVSKSTVSRVITGSGSIKDSTRHRIEKAMRELNYTPSYLAQGIRTGKTKTIALMVEETSNLYYNELLYSVEKIATENDYMVFLLNGSANGDHAQKYMAWLRQRQVDGVICCFYRDNAITDELYRMSKTLPVVFLDNPQPLDSRPGISCIGTDGLNDTAEIVRYLHSTGSRRIAFIGINDIRNITYRYLGYRASMTACGCDLDEKLVFFDDPQPPNESHFTLGGRAAQILMAQPAPPDAIISATDMLAVGALQYLQENGYRVPDQVRLTGYDNIILSTMCTPKLSTMSQPIDQIAKESMHVLIRKIQQGSDYNHSVLLKSKFIRREST